MITVFVLLTGEWVDAMEPVAAISGTPSVLFFVAVVIIGKYLLVNLLVAVILLEFATGESRARESSAGLLSTRRTDDGEDSFRTTTSRSSPDDSFTARHSPRQALASTGRSATHLAYLGSTQEIEEPVWPDDYSLYCFSPSSPIRRWCLVVMARPEFDRFVMLAIVASSLLLALETPRNSPDAPITLYLAVSYVLFTCIFFLEMVIKLIATGAMFGHGAYFRSPWNQLDFVIVLTSVLVIAAETIPQLKPLRILRLLRVMRPLRIISRNAGMRLIITSLFKAMPSVSNVFGVVLFLQIAFAIVGMQLLMGEMSTCNNPHILTRSECTDGAAPPQAMVGWDPNLPLRWSNAETGSFDNFGESMRLLYVMSSADQWELPMWQMMGATEPGHAPARNDFAPMALFPIAWMFFGFVFAINLFVGVVIDNFSRMQKEEDGQHVSMTLEQNQWASTMQAMGKMSPFRAVRPPRDWWRLIAFRLVHARAFDSAITVVIGTNILVMACDYWGIEEDVDTYRLYGYVMDVFSYVYYVECALKMVAFGVKGYFDDSWCRFDFLLVCLALIDQLATEVLAAYLPLPPMLLRVLRVFRILRILRLLKGAKQLRDLIVTIILSFPSLLNVSSLLALLLFIYSVLGVGLFTFVSHGGANGGMHGGLNAVRNFHTFGSSFLLLFQCLTGDGWSSLMSDTMVQESSGLCSEAAGDCGSSAAIPYFVTFQALGTFIFLNLVVAVILENFSNLHSTNPELVSTSDLEVFAEAWSEFDPDATNYMSSSDLPALLLKVPPPLGLKGKTPFAARRLCMRLRIPVHKGADLTAEEALHAEWCIQFHEVVYELVNNNFFREGTEHDKDEFFSAVPNLKLPGPLNAMTQYNAHAATQYNAHSAQPDCEGTPGEEETAEPTSAADGPNEEESIDHLYALAAIGPRMKLMLQARAKRAREAVATNARNSGSGVPTIAALPSGADAVSPPSRPRRWARPTRPFSAPGPALNTAPAATRTVQACAVGAALAAPLSTEDTVTVLAHNGGAPGDGVSSPASTSQRAASSRPPPDTDSTTPPASSAFHLRIASCLSGFTERSQLGHGAHAAPLAARHREETQVAVHSPEAECSFCANRLGASGSASYSLESGDARDRLMAATGVPAPAPVAVVAATHDQEADARPLGVEQTESLPGAVTSPPHAWKRSFGRGSAKAVRSLFVRRARGSPGRASPTEAALPGFSVV